MYNGMKHVDGLTSDDAIRGERSWAYSRSNERTEVDTFWLMAQEEFRQYNREAPVRKLSARYMDDQAAAEPVKQTERRQTAAADIARAAYAISTRRK
jgi:hypothetical protein